MTAIPREVYHSKKGWFVVCMHRRTAIGFFGRLLSAGYEGAGGYFCADENRMHFLLEMIFHDEDACGGAQICRGLRGGEALCLLIILRLISVLQADGIFSVG